MITKKTITLLLTAAFLVSLASAVILAFAENGTASASFFAENRGQFEQDVVYRLEGSRSTLWALEDEIWLMVSEPGSESIVRGPGGASLTQPARAANLRIRFPDAGAGIHPVAEGRVDIQRNYLTPSGAFNNVPLWESIRYNGISPGVDLELRATGTGLAMILHGEPEGGADPVRITVEGAERALHTAGGLALQTALGDVPFPLFSGDTGVRLALSTENGATAVFAPAALQGDAPRSGPDAGTLIYGTYYGNLGFYQYASQVVSDSAGNAYAAGGADTPALVKETGLVTPLHLVTAFVIKLNPAGTAAAYVTTITGTDPNGEDFATGVAIDSTGGAYVTGLTSSNDFPATPGAYDETQNGGNDAWLARLNPSGSVAFASVIGTPTNEWANAIDVGIFNDIYISGFSNGAGFPTTPGAYDTSQNGGFDVFVSRFSNDGTTLLSSTFIGGSADEGGDINLDRSDILLDSVSGVYITGPTESSNFPKTNSKIGPGGCKDIYIARLSPALDSLTFSTRIGGSGSSCGVDGDDNAEKLALDPAGNIFIAGYTSTENGNGFPTTAGAYDTSYNGFFDGFLLKLNPDASSVLYGTFIGGSSVDVMKDVGLDSSGDVYMNGYTFSSDYPTSGDAYDSSLSGGVDALVTKITPAGGGGSDLVYSTYFGGNNVDQGIGIYVFGQDILYLSGLTSSSDFPITTGSYQDTYSGDQDGYVALFHLPNPLPPSPTPAWTPAPFNLNVPITENN